jgi:hypothetical protein
MSTISEVYQAALSLSADERSELAHHLLLSLEPDEPDPNVDQLGPRKCSAGVKRFLKIRRD